MDPDIYDRNYSHSFTFNTSIVKKDTTEFNQSVIVALSLSRTYNLYSKH